MCSLYILKKDAKHEQFFSIKILVLVNQQMNRLVKHL